MTILIIILTALIAFACGYILRFLFGKLSIKSAEQLSEKIVKDAEVKAASKLKEALLEAKTSADIQKRAFEQEMRERKHAVQNLENRLNQREEHLDRKVDSLEKRESLFISRERDFISKEQKLQLKFAEIEKVKAAQIEALEKLSNLTKEEAKNMLIKNMEDEAKRDAAALVQKISEEAQET
ncbi:MAG: Rnase Y domain-containing protein, partial [Elusimicrobiota bacterium]|nr:Rnase Y domain-containing protein [Elusimicrobiota bacterium]